MKILIPIYCLGVLLLTTTLFQDPELKKSRERGSEIYADFCVTCHLDNGEGVAYTFPPLANSDYLVNNRDASIHAVKYGLQGEITVNGITYNSAMSNMGLDNGEIADVLNYIMNSWGNTQNEMVTEAEVGSIEK